MLVRNLWRAYESLLRQRPVLTQTATSAALWACGDVAAQRIEGSGSALHWDRTGKTAMFGGLLMGPLGHFWYQALDRTATKRMAPGSPRFVLFKIAVDEVVFGPLHVVAFFTFMTKALGGTWQDMGAKLQHDFLSTYLAELSVWPAYQALNFTFVPVRHQLLAVNVGCLLDATLLCWIQSQEDWTSRLFGWVRPQEGGALSQAGAGQVAVDRVQDA